MCNANGFVIAFSFPPSCQCFRMELAKGFFASVLSFVIQEVDDQIRLISLDTLADVFISVLSIVKFCVCKHNMPFALEINSNGKTNQAFEILSSTTKNISTVTQSL